MPEIHILVSLLEQFQGRCSRPSHSCWDLSSSLCTFAVIAVKRTAASAMELQIGSIWRSLSLKGSRLCGGLGSLPATARPFSEFHPTLLLIFFFFWERNLLEQGNTNGWPPQLSSLISQHFVGDAASLTSVHPGLPGSSEMFAHYLIAELFKRVALWKRTSVSERERDISTRKW